MSLHIYLLLALITIGRTNQLYSQEKPKFDHIIEINGKTGDSLYVEAVRLDLAPAKTSVLVRINSEGGRFDPAQLLAKELRRKNSTCIVDGSVSSAAYLVFLSCKNRYYTKGSTIMAHWIVTVWNYVPSAEAIQVDSMQNVWMQGGWDFLGMSVTGMTEPKYLEFRNRREPMLIKQLIEMSPNKWATEVSK